jgi:Ala-tRNA(Pro) deacylase
MSVAKRLGEHLAKTDVPFEVVSHPWTASSNRSAQAAHVTGERVAKTVVLHDDGGYLLAVVPSTHRLELDTLQRFLDRRMNLASEREIAGLFDDCEIGAVPPVGAAYGLDVVVDESVTSQPDVYFEGGDHRSLVRVSGSDFAALVSEARHGRFSHHV